MGRDEQCRTRYTAEIKGEISSVRQMLNCKDINNKVTDIFKSTSKVFNTMCQKFKLNVKSQQVSS